MSMHVPVLLNECLELLAVQPGMTVVDGTLGGGGHTTALALRVGPSGRIISLDRDPAAAAAFAPRQPSNVIVRVANFCDAVDVLEELGIESVDAALLDLGLSSDQLADQERGFSFHSHGPLDLRFDPTRGEPAWRLLKRISERDLADLIYRYGEERASRAIARRICAERRARPIETAGHLADLVRQCVRRSKHHAIDPATRTFQALRIAVNRELESLQTALDRLPFKLRPGGRLAVISFHSLEDRVVKQAFRDATRWSAVTRKPVVASELERQSNPRSRSAKLRVGELQAGP